MKEHGEVNEILDGGHIRYRSGDRWDAVDKERELFASPRHGDIPIDGVFIVNHIEIPPLGMDGGLVNRRRGLRQEAIGKDEAKKNRQNAEGLSKGGLRKIWLWPKKEYRNEGIRQGDNKGNFKRIEILNEKKGHEQSADDGPDAFKDIDLSNRGDIFLDVLRIEFTSVGE